MPRLESSNYFDQDNPFKDLVDYDAYAANNSDVQHNSTVFSEADDYASYFSEPIAEASLSPYDGLPYCLSSGNFRR